MDDRSRDERIYGEAMRAIEGEIVFPMSPAQIQEQQKEVDELKKTVTRLFTENKALEAANDVLHEANTELEQSLADTREQYHTYVHDTLALVSEMDTCPVCKAKPPYHGMNCWIARYVSK